MSSCSISLTLQVVDGNRLMNTPYDLSFRADRDHVSLCSKQLTQSEITKFRKVSLHRTLTALHAAGHA